MKNFKEIVAGIGKMPATVRTDVGLEAKITHNSGGGGRWEESLIIALPSNPGIHLTMYCNTWDQTGNVEKYGDSPLGPHCIHLTSSIRHVFYVIEEVEGGYSKTCLSDRQSTQENKAFNYLFAALIPYL